MNAPTDWVSAIVILAAGLILGLVLVVYFSRRKAAGRPVDDEAGLELKDLEGKRDALIQQLRELDTDSKLTPAQAAAERDQLEHATADVLRRIDELALRVEPRAEATEAADQASGMNPALKGFLWGAGSFVMLFGLGWFVMKSASPRSEGGSVTGGIESSQPAQPGQPAQPDPALMQMEAAVMRDPENLQLRNDLAQAYLERDNMMGVFEQAQFVLERSPKDARALTFQGLVRLAMGDADAALTALRDATKSDPKSLDSWVAMAWVYAQTDRMKDAEAAIAEAVKQVPSEKSRLEAVFNDMKNHLANVQAAPAVAQGSGELPPGHPPVEGMGASPAPAQTAPVAAAARPPAPTDGKSIQVTLDLDPAARTRTGILYVMARNPQGGPPVAVKRMEVSRFPITFEFGSADSMMGQPLPDHFQFEARLDSDGDAATKPPTDPSVVQADVHPGSTLKLALK